MFLLAFLSRYRRRCGETLAFLAFLPIYLCRYGNIVDVVVVKY
jgi:hypothetical protein